MTEKNISSPLSETTAIQRQLAALAKMRDKFPDKEVCYRPIPLVKREEYDKLPKAQCKICSGYHATSRTGHLSYVGHAAITNRLLDCDPAWSWRPMSLDENGLPRFDASGGLWGYLMVAGMERPCYGNSEPMPYSERGAREKAVIGDMLRNGCMRFGAALEMWHKGTLGEPDPVFEYGPVSARPVIEMPVAKDGNKDNPYAETQASQKVVPNTDAAHTAIPVEPEPVTPMEPAQAADMSVPLAEPGEKMFIEKKLAALKQTSPEEIMQCAGIVSLDGLTKTAFKILQTALKGKK